MQQPLTVIIAPNGAIEGVRGVLHDWAAAGLLDDFVWAPADDNLDSDAACLHIAGANLRASTVRTVVADAGAREIQLCSLVPLLASSAVHSLTTEQAMAHLLSNTGAAVRRVRAVLTTSGAVSAPERVAVEGWANFVIVPEDRATPNAPSVSITPSTLAQLVDVHLAHGLAGLLGLWSGMASPLSGREVSPGQNAQLVSSYYRKLTADAAEGALRAAVLSTDQGMPRPRRHGSTAVYVSNPHQAVATMAEAWWHKHGDSLRGHREAIVEPVPRPVTVGDALRMFFGYMIAAIKNAPGAWLDRLQASVYSGVARRVTSAVYGSGSAYQVVVKGMTGDGRPARMLDVSRSTAGVEAALGAAGMSRRQEAPADNAEMWGDFVSGALTLADGGGRDEHLPPIVVGTNLGVVREADLIAPTPAASFHALSGQLSAILDVTEVAAYDVLEVDDLQQRLDGNAQTPGLQFEVSSAREHLKQWRATRSPGYAGAVAGRIADAYRYTLGEIQQLLGILDEAAGGGKLEADEEQRALARRIRRILVGSLVALTVVIGVLIAGVLAVVLGAIIGAVVLIGGLLGLFSTFFRGQKRVFQLLNRRKALDDAAEIAARNLQSALRDLRRISDAYGQLMVWSPVLARFLSEPFGPIAEPPADTLRLSGPFPRAMQIGVVERNPEAEATAAADIRRELFTVGWLAEPWQALLDGAPRRLRPADAEFVNSTPALYRQLPLGSDGSETPLRRWATFVITQGTGAEGGTRIWHDIVERRLAGRSDHVAALADTVRVLGREVPASRTSFFDGLDDSATGAARFETSLLSNRAATQDAGLVDDTVPHDVPDGLSRFLVVTQFSADIAGYDFGGPAVAFRRPEPAPVPNRGSGSAPAPAAAEPPADPYAVPPMPVFGSPAEYDRGPGPSESGRSPW